jgi:hypothetical protein
MKRIQITTSVSCELTENFLVNDEVFDEFVSELASIRDLDCDEKQEYLIELYEELLEDAEEIKNIRFVKLDIPECINEVNCFNR